MNRFIHFNLVFSFCSRRVGNEELQLEIVGRQSAGQTEHNTTYQIEDDKRVGVEGRTLSEKKWLDGLSYSSSF